jgi:proteasome lid subunit RPN8/RPN11
MEADNLDLSAFPVTDAEECGIVIGRMRDGKRIPHRIVKVRNYAADPTEDYAVAMLDLQKTIRGLDDDEHVIGFFHTHLSDHLSSPSKNDFAGAKIFPNFINLVYKPSTGEMTWYSSSRIIEGPFVDA